MLHESLTKSLCLKVYDKYNGNLPEGIIAARPSYIPSLEIERIQNALPEPGEELLITVKEDGEQRTFYYDDNGIFRMASKNALLDLNEASESNRTLYQNNYIFNLARAYYVFAEYVGPGIRGNRSELTYKTFKIISLVNYQGYELPYGEMIRLIESYPKLSPVYSSGIDVMPANYRMLIEQIKILKHYASFKDAEGIVFHSLSTGKRYKAIYSELGI